MWLTDRTRYLTGLADCQMKRYLTFHSANGYGMVRKAQAMPLATGIYVHEALAEVLLHCQLAQTLKQPIDLESKEFKKVVRDAIQRSQEAYLALIAARGYLNLDEDENASYIVKEQSTLVAGLVWGWVRSQLQGILNEFEIIAVEREEELVVGCSCGKHGLPSTEHSEDCHGICQMSRPDFVLRRLADDTYGIHDFKTASVISDSYINEFRTSVQMAVGTLSVEARLGHPVEHYYVHALVKGSRKKEYNTSDRDYTGPRRQNSVFCYGWYKPGNPPLDNADWQPSFKWFDDEGKGHTLGKAYGKMPIWEAEFPSKPEDQSNVEYWVMTVLPEHVVHNQFMMIGPYARQEALIKEYLSEMVAEEHRWIQRNWNIYQAEEKYGTGSKEHQQALRANITRSWNCYKYNSACVFTPICFKQPGVEEPLKTNLYTLRRPHHEYEIQEMVARGVEVPEKEVEEEEE